MTGDVMCLTVVVNRYGDDLVVFAVACSTRHDLNDLSVDKLKQPTSVFFAVHKFLKILQGEFFRCCNHTHTTSLSYSSSCESSGSTVSRLCSVSDAAVMPNRIASSRSTLLSSPKITALEKASPAPVASTTLILWARMNPLPLLSAYATP